MENNNNTWGKQVIEKALEYANYKWTASEANVLHGTDSDGRFVDTPDITWCGEVLDCGWWKVDEVNVGIPYSWGNASTLEEFEQGDVFAIPGSHVMFFKEFTNEEKTEVIIIDATRNTGKVSVRTEHVVQLFENGYKIYRKKHKF